MITLDLSHKKQRFDDAVFAATNLEHKRLTIERELQDLKWFGYRFMTPLALTKLFYETYRRLRVDYVREHKDIELANELPAVPFSAFAKDPKKLAMAWTARQAADTFGVPYELYVEFGMRFWSRRGGGGRSNVPQINQLGYTDKTEAAWRGEFEKFLSDDRLWAASRSLADVSQLHPAVFDGTSEQIAARDFIVDLCARSGRSWTNAIATWCHWYPVITPGCFERVVPSDVLDTAVATAATIAPESNLGPQPLPPGALWPTCHGMPDALDTGSTTCSNCRFSDSCSRLASMVMSEVLRKTGHEEPRRVALRAPKNERMRRLRAKQKASATVLPCASASPSSVTLP